MKIGILGIMSKPITRQSAGGTEVFTALLAEGLAQKGNDVYLFATAESKLKGVNLIPVAQKTRASVRSDYIAKYNQEFTSSLQETIDYGLVARVLIKAKEYESQLDLFHDNTASFLAGSVSDLFSLPMVTTMHMPPNDENPYMRVPSLITMNINYYVPVSKWQKEHANISNDAIYNGIDLENYIFDANGGEALIWIGRISPHAQKGLKEALRICPKIEKPFIFAGNVTNQTYYDQEIKPLLNNPFVKERGIINTIEEKNLFLKNAKAALFPIQWDEPFGFVFTEAMACGTPVIAYARGSVPEIVVDGQTGFIVNSSETDKRGDWIVKKTGLEGIKEAVEKIYALPVDQYQAMRRACRQRVEKLFTVERMVNEYEVVYKKILQKSRG